MSFDELLEVLLKYAIPGLLIFGILGGLYFFKSLDKAHFVLVIYLGVCLLVDLSSRVYAAKYGNNLIFIPISGFLELTTFSFFYYQFLSKKRWLYPLVLAALVFIVYEALSINVANVADFQAYSRAIASFLVTLMSINCFFEWIGSEQSIPGNLWFLNSGILIFYAFNLICFLPVNFLINVDSDVKFSFWFANFLVTLIFYIVLSFVIWKHGKSRRRLHHG